MYLRNQQNTVQFLLINNTDGSAVTSGTTNVSVIKDGGSASAASNSAVHRTNGVWSIVLTATEMDADVVTISATNSNAVPQMVSIRTVPVLTDTMYAGITALIAGVNVTDVTGTPVSDIDDFKADISTLSTFDHTTDEVTFDNTIIDANIVSVTGTAVVDVDDFKADLAGVTVSITNATINANVVSVQGGTVASIADFVGSTTGLSTFDPASDYVQIITNGVNAVTFSSTGVEKVVTGIFDHIVDGTIDAQTMSEMLLAFMSGKVDVTDNGSTRTFTYYRRDGSTESFEVTASELESFEGQRASGGTIT